MYYIYILECSDGKPYTGCTQDLKERIDYKAFEFEKYLKSGPGRAFIKKHLTQYPTSPKATKDTVGVTRVLKIVGRLKRVFLNYKHV